MSIAANIVEGSSRGSDQDFAKFVQIAIGSASELEYHLHVAADLNFISQEELAARIIAEGLSVRAVEGAIREHDAPPSTPATTIRWSPAPMTLPFSQPDSALARNTAAAETSTGAPAAAS